MKEKSAKTMIKTRLQINVDKRSLSPHFTDYLSLLLGVEADDGYLVFSCGAWRRMIHKTDAPGYKNEHDLMLTLMEPYSDSCLLCFTKNLMFPNAL